MHEGIRNIMETHPDSQYLQGVFDMSSQYLHLTHADNRMQNWSTHVVPADTFVPANVNQVQRIPRRGRGHRRAQHDEAGTSNQGERAPSHHGEQTPLYQGEPSGSNTQFTQNIFNTEAPGPYLYTTPPPYLTFPSSQDSPQFGNMLENCYQPSYDHNVNRNNSPISFEGFDIDMNVPWDQYETQEVVEEGRPRRNRRAPDCGTGGRLGHHH